MADTATPTTSSSRVVDGRSVPAPGTWTTDPSHSQVGFVARHLMVTKVRGRFTDYAVTITVADKPEDSSVQVSIQAASITTGDDGRDNHLRSGDFLEVEKYPTLEFASTAVRPGRRDDAWEVDGNLTIHGVTKPVTLDMTFGGVTTDPWGNDKAIFEASTQIDREDFGLTWNQPLANGGVLVSKKITIEIEVQAARAQA